MDCQWVGGEGLYDKMQNWNLKTIPFGEVNQKKSPMREETELFGSKLRSEVELDGNNIELKTYYYAAPSTFLFPLAC